MADAGKARMIMHMCVVAKGADVGSGPFACADLALRAMGEHGVRPYAIAQRNG